MQHRKKILIAAAAVVVIVSLAVALLIRNANTLLKERLETMAGEGLSIESLALNWGSVRAEGIRFVSGKEPVAEAASLILKADFWAALTKDIAISSIELEKPVIHLSLDKEGKPVNPFTTGAGKSSGASAPLPPLEIREIIIREGTVTLRDGRLPGDRNTTTFSRLNLRFTGFSYPFRDTPSQLELSALIDGFLAAGDISCSGDINLATMAMKMNIEGKGLSLIRRAQGTVAKADGVRAFLLSEGKGKGYVIPEIVLTGPFLELETDGQGRLISPSPFPKEDETGKGEESRPVTIQDLSIKGGRLIYLDGKVSKQPQGTEINAIEMTMSHISFPFDDAPTTYSFSGRIPKKGGTGELAWKGRTNFLTLDSDSHMELKGLDITGFKPYFQKKGDADVTKGLLDLSMDMKIRDRRINAPGRAVIRDLDFAAGKGIGDKFIGVPRSLVISLLQSGDNRIPIDFTLEGDLSNPKFNMRESFTRRLTVGLAGKLGLSVVDVGGAVVDLGSKGVGTVGEGLKGVGEGLKKLFGK